MALAKSIISSPGALVKCTCVLLFQSPCKVCKPKASPGNPSKGHHRTQKQTQTLSSQTLRAQTLGSQSLKAQTLNLKNCLLVFKQERKLKKGSEVIKEIYRELPKLAAQKRLERRPASQIPQRQIATSATSQNGAGMGSRRCLRSFF